MDMHYRNVDVTNGWHQKCAAYGFVAVLECWRNGDFDTWILRVHPEEAQVYSLFTETTLQIASFTAKIDADVWEDDCTVFEKDYPHYMFVDVSLKVHVIQALSPQQLSIQTPYRNFKLLCDSQSFFVDTLYLSSLGGQLFTEWSELKSKGRKSLEITDLSSAELVCLLDATIKYRQIMVTRRNYDDLASIAYRFRIASILRAIESFVIDSVSIHPIRKMEIAVNYKLARLGDTISKELLSSGTAVSRLHEYLLENGETMDKMHPDVLVSLNIHSDYAIM